MYFEGFLTNMLSIQLKVLSVFLVWVVKSGIKRLRFNFQMINVQIMFSIYCFKMLQSIYLDVGFEYRHSQSYSRICNMKYDTHPLYWYFFGLAIHGPCPPLGNSLWYYWNYYIRLQFTFTTLYYVKRKQKHRGKVNKSLQRTRNGCEAFRT